MKKASFIIAVALAIAALYVFARWLAMETPAGNFCQFTSWVDDLNPDGTTSVEWCFFRDFDFPTGKCERILLDIPMTTLGIVALAISFVSGIISYCLGKARKHAHLIGSLRS